MAFLMLLRRMGRSDLTAHGFRATFKTWASERTSFQNEIVEASLAHTIGGKVEQAYQRGDVLAKRRRLMQQWATFCTTAPAVDAQKIVSVTRFLIYYRTAADRLIPETAVSAPACRRDLLAERHAEAHSYEECVQPTRRRRGAAIFPCLPDEIGVRLEIVRMTSSTRPELQNVLGPLPHNQYRSTPFVTAPHQHCPFANIRTTICEMPALGRRPAELRFSGGCRKAKAVPVLPEGTPASYCALCARIAARYLSSSSHVRSSSA